MPIKPSPIKTCCYRIWSIQPLYKKNTSTQYQLIFHEKCWIYNQITIYIYTQLYINWAIFHIDHHSFKYNQHMLNNFLLCTSITAQCLNHHLQSHRWGVGVLTVCYMKYENVRFVLCFVLLWLYYHFAVVLVYFPVFLGATYLRCVARMRLIYEWIGVTGKYQL